MAKMVGTRGTLRLPDGQKLEMSAISHDWPPTIEGHLDGFWETPALPGGIVCTICGKPAVSAEGTYEGLNLLSASTAELINPQITGYCEEHTPPELQQVDDEIETTDGY